jgi:hypothetical protein
VSYFRSFLLSKKKGEVIAWWGGGTIVAFSGLWTAFVYVVPLKDNAGDHKAPVSASSAGVAVGGNVANSTINTGAFTGLGRPTQPIDMPIVQVLLSLDCEHADYKAFCATIRKTGDEVRSKTQEGVSYVVQNVDWSKWPKHSLFFETQHLSTRLELHFFKNLADAEMFIGSGNPFASASGDLNMVLEVRAEDEGGKKPNLRIQYDTKTKRVEIYACSKDVRVDMKNDNIALIPDIPGSALVVTESMYRLFDHGTLEAVQIRTIHGQTVDVQNPQLNIMNGRTRVFAYHLPSEQVKTGEPNVDCPI